MKLSGDHSTVGIDYGEIHKRINEMIYKNRSIVGFSFDNVVKIAFRAHTFHIRVHRFESDVWFQFQILAYVNSIKHWIVVQVLGFLLPMGDTKMSYCFLILIWSNPAYCRH